MDSSVLLTHAEQSWLCAATQAADAAALLRLVHRKQRRLREARVVGLPPARGHVQQQRRRDDAPALAHHEQPVRRRGQQSACRVALEMWGDVGRSGEIWGVMGSPAAWHWICGSGCRQSSSLPISSTQEGKRRRSSDAACAATASSHPAAGWSSATNPPAPATRLAPEVAVEASGARGVGTAAAVAACAALATFAAGRGVGGRVAGRGRCFRGRRASVCGTPPREGSCGGGAATRRGETCGRLRFRGRRLAWPFASLARMGIGVRTARPPPHACSGTPQAACVASGFMWQSQRSCKGRVR